MKILFCTHYSGFGGANRCMISLICEFLQKGIQSFVILPERGPIEEELKKYHISYKVIPYINWVCPMNYPKHTSRHFVGIIYRFIRNIYAVINIIVYILNNKIDIVHTNDSLTIVGACAAKALKKPHVWHIREFLDDDYSMQYFMNEKYVMRMYNESHAVITISQAVLKKYKNRIDSSKIKVIYDGIKFKEFEKRNKFPRFTVMFAGGSNVHKGGWMLLTIAKELEKAEIDIIFAGTINDSKMLRYMETNKLKNINYLGFTDEIKKYRTSSHLFLMLSDKEAFGLVTVEAMLDKTLVLASNSGANTEIIQEGKTGFLYQANSSKNLLEKILWIKKNYDSISFIEDEAFQYAQNNFLIEQAANKVLEIYNAEI